VGCLDDCLAAGQAAAIAFIDEFDQHQRVVDHHPGDPDDGDEAVDRKQGPGQHGAEGNAY